MRVFLFLLPLLLASLFLQPASAQQTRVLLTHSRYDSGDTSNEYLIGYYFKNGVFAKQDTILHRSHIGDSEDDGRISVGLGGDKIFHDRYFYSTIGILVDLWEKKLLWEKSNLQFVKKEGQRLYFNRSFFTTTLDLYEYDLEKRVYRSVLKRPFNDYCFRLELCAPDYNHFLQTRYEGPGKAAIFLVDSMGKERKLAIASKADRRFSGSRAKMETPIAWTDQSHFVFPNYIIRERNKKELPGIEGTNPKMEQVFVRMKPDSLPCCSVELIELDIRSGATRFITTINGLYEPMVDDKLLKNEAGQLVFRNRGADTSQSFLIDLATGETKMDGPRSSPFRITAKNRNSGDDAPIDIFFEEKKIGKFYVLDNYLEEKTIVIVGSEKPDDPDSLFVWSVEHPNWQKIPVDRFLNVFGWMN